MNWSTAKSTCEGKSAVTNAAWLLPSIAQWKAMFGANGGDDTKYTGLNNALAAAGGDSSKLQEGVDYWLSTEIDPGVASYRVRFNEGNVIWNSAKQTKSYSVRACLAF